MKHNIATSALSCSSELLRSFKCDFRRLIRKSAKENVDVLYSQYSNISYLLIFLTWFTVNIWKVNNFHITHSLNNYANEPMSKIMITFLAHLNNEII